MGAPTLRAAAWLRLVALVAATLVCTPALAWKASGTCSGNTPTHWAPGNPNSVWKYSSSFQSADLSSSVVTSRIQSAFDEWARPGCSEFNATQGASAAGDPMGSSSDNLIGFYESNWPSSLGGSTVLAVTFTTWSSGTCVIPEADMVINGVNYKWVDGQPTSGNQADLQAIVTHESGHWVGLDHSTYSGSSLNAYYSGGLGERTLTCDDTQGVCTLNPSGGNTCINDNYCACGVGCNSGTCNGTSTPPTDNTCAGSPLSANEAEPNDWEGDNDVNWFAPDTGGDLTINGNITCGNDGTNYTGDYDWYLIDFPCSGDARFTLDWSGASDLDFQVWDTSSNDPFAFNFEESTEGPTTDTATAGGRIYIFVACWSGASTSYSMTVDWAPFTPIDTGGNPGDDTGPGPDDSNGGGFDSGSGLASCLCTQAGSWQGAVPGMWLALLAVTGLRRRRA